MSDFAYLNKYRVRSGYFASDDSFGCNGAFLLMIGSANVRVIASDGEGWQHVSVTLVASHKPRNANASKHYGRTEGVKPHMKQPLKVTFSIQPWIHEGDETETPKCIRFEKLFQNDGSFDQAFDDFIYCVKQSMKRHASKCK